MQLSLDRFGVKKTKKQQINEEIASKIEVRGLEKVAGLHEILGEIFSSYEL